MVHQIFYLSSSKSEIMNEEVVNEIVAKAQVQNAKNGITGILLFKKGIFLQLLEGPEESVKALFNKIEKDPRHSNIIKYFEIEENERLFPEWQMGFKEIGDVDFKMVNEILSWNKLISKAGNIDNNLILTMLGRFKAK